VRPAPHSPYRYSLRPRACACSLRSARMVVRPPFFRVGARCCLSCGNCFERDNCYSVCPGNAVRKLGPGKGFAVDLDYCKGCGLCVAECLCGAIEMVDEET